MAHECPECGVRCHCGGDIDDIVLPDTAYEARCHHCQSERDDGQDYGSEYQEWYEEDEDDG